MRSDGNNPTPEKVTNEISEKHVKPQPVNSGSPKVTIPSYHPQVTTRLVVLGSMGHLGRGWSFLCYVYLCTSLRLRSVIPVMMIQPYDSIRPVVYLHIVNTDALLLLCMGTRHCRVGVLSVGYPLARHSHLELPSQYIQ